MKPTKFDRQAKNLPKGGKQTKPDYADDHNYTRGGTGFLYTKGMYVPTGTTNKKGD